MKRFLAVTLLLLLVGCQSGKSANTSFTPGLTGNQQAPIYRPDGLDLKLTASDQGGSWRLELLAVDADDLYQLAGSLLYDQNSYSVYLVEAGGGLGGPEDCYFVSGEPVPGSIDFAYTRKFYGAGVSGDACLLVFHVTPDGVFNIDDFDIPVGADALVARDSTKAAFSAHLAREVL